MSELDLLIGKRKHIRGQITRTHGTVGQFSQLFNDVDRSVKLSTLKDLKVELKNLDSLIQGLKFGEKHAEKDLMEELNNCSHYFNLINICIVHLEQLAVNKENPQALKCPKTPLPRFSSKEGEDFTRFLSLFNTTVDKFKLTDYDKLILFKQQLSGSALVLVESLSLDNQTFKDAVDLLSEALASPDTQKHNVLKQLSEINTYFKDNPLEYISKMRMIQDTVKKLKIDVDYILGYFFWQGLPKEFKVHVTHILNKTKPSLSELNKVYFDATELFQENKKSKSNKVKSDNFKENVTNAFASEVKAFNKSVPDCQLCLHDKLDNSHPLFKCNKYNNAKLKIDKINELEGCVKCGSLKHKISKCNFKLKKRCGNCSRWHFQYLCSVNKVKSENVKASEPKPSESKPSVASSNNSIITEAFPNSHDDTSILSTFTCNINGNELIRGFKDPGCQSNFITDNLANSLNLEVVKSNVILNIKGFNETKKYNTKIVNLDFLVGDKVRKIQALCVPEINIKIKIPNLCNIAKHFTDKGYSIADKALLDGSDEISNIEFLLGSKSSYCLKTNEIDFGPNKDSIYGQTDLGVILMGDSNVILRNLSSLPFNYSNVNSNLVTNDIDKIINENCNLNSNFETNAHFAFMNSDSSFEDIFQIDSVAYFLVSDKDGKLNNSELGKALGEVLYNEDNSKFFKDDSSTEINKILVDFVLRNTKRNEEGRLVMPLLWHSEVSHLLGQNYDLAKSILNSNLRKLKNKPDFLHLMDEVFKTQEELGIIKRIEDFSQYKIEHPNHSFLPHMGVFRPNRETTKVRVVYLSNLSQKLSNNSITMSHNQAMHSGPCLNKKLTTALLELRFDSKLLVFDLVKAFNQICLSENDSARLLCLWHKNISKGDFSLTYFKNDRLPFGLRCSPTLLMLGLYIILIVNVVNDNEFLINLKKMLYHLFYMDNGAVTSNDSDYLMKCYDCLNEIFNEYGFQLQQFTTNCPILHEKLVKDHKVCDSETNVKLLGMIWNKERDTLSCKQIYLDQKANTKRKVLQTIASQWDAYNINAPLMNRSRLFLHRLQINKTLDWDTVLSSELLKEWINICKQVNSSPILEIPRFVGSRSDLFNIIACTDASKTMYGVVIYLHNVVTGLMSFIISKNRIVNSDLKLKSVPCLELQAILLGTQTLINLYDDISGPTAVIPIKINSLILYTDSIVCLAWLNNYTNKFSKMQQKSVFVLNRLEEVRRFCDIHPISFEFISGVENPADYITREVSYKQIIKTNYISGPKIDAKSNSASTDIMKVVVPNPDIPNEINEVNYSSNIVFQPVETLIDFSRYSDFHFLTNILVKVKTFIHKLKVNVKKRRPNLFSNFDLEADLPNFYSDSVNYIIKYEQSCHFGDIFEYLLRKDKKIKDMPSLVRQLNIFIDRNGLLRVKTKLQRISNLGFYNFPIFMPRDSHLTRLIILSLHNKLLHAGCYVVLTELKKRFWITKGFVTVKKVLKSCVLCRRYNQRTIKLNQSPYRSFRIDPPQIPYRNIFIDFMGPFTIKLFNQNRKVYILIITCMWTRAINLILCYDLSVQQYLRAFQIHTFQWGLPELCLSDLGSQLVSGNNTIATFLSDPKTETFFNENGVKTIEFQHYPKGNSELGSSVEVCVKLTKKLLYSSLGKNIVSLSDFDYLIKQVIHLVNRRPIAFQESLRDFSGDCMPDVITPELMTHGYDLISCNVIPELQTDPLSDPNDPLWTLNNDKIRDSYKQLKLIRTKLIDVYYNEFLTKLAYQAADKDSRYKPVSHNLVEPGDIVLIKEEFSKPLNYPLALVKSVTKNILGETTEAVLFKGKTREITRRHISNLIPYLSKNEQSNDTDGDVEVPNTPVNKQNISVRPKRKAAIKALSKIKTQLD